MRTSIRIKFRPSADDGQKGTIYYQIICGRKVRQIGTALRIFHREWDESRSFPVIDECSPRREEIRAIRLTINADIMRIKRLVSRLRKSGEDFSADDIVREYHDFSSRFTLYAFMTSIIKSLRAMGRRRTSDAYRSALSSFRNFMGGDDLMIDCITAEILQRYESYLSARGVCQNSRSFYMRILRATFNRAADLGAVEQTHPFRHVSTGVYRTAKRALPIKTIRCIRDIDLSGLSPLGFARDMFMMSFYTRGMSFIDMANLRKSDLRNGYLTYQRRKTGQELTVKWTSEMQTILEKYPPNPTKYLLPIITKPDCDPYYAYRNQIYRINYSLHRVGEMVGTPFPLTMYCARHSWASAARSSGIPVSIISEGMGHDSELTTKIYLATLDTSAIDRANSKIIKAIG